MTCRPKKRKEERKEGRKEERKEGRKETGREEGKREGRTEGGREGKKEGRKPFKHILGKYRDKKCRRAPERIKRTELGGKGVHATAGHSKPAALVECLNYEHAFLSKINK